MVGLVVALSLLVTPAQAQDETTAAQVAAASAAGDMGVNVRYRYMFLPKTILDTWYFDSDDPGAMNFDRPKISAHVVGMEYAFETAPTSILLYGEYWKVNMEEGYWDDYEDPPVHTDGDWLRANKLGAAALGANFGHEVAVTSNAKESWLGLRLGGGVGLLVPTGRVDTWHPGANISTEPTNNCQPDGLAYDRQAACDPDEELRIPPVLPVVDMDLALRMHFGPNILWRIDGGLHDMVYFGTAFGAVW